MNKTAVLALMAGLLGGLLTRYITPPTAYAQNQPFVSKEVRAQTFTLVDPSDRTLGTFSAETIRRGTFIRNPGSPYQTVEPREDVRIILRDTNGRELWSAGAEAQLRPLTSERSFSK